MTDVFEPHGVTQKAAEGVGQDLEAFVEGKLGGAVLGDLTGAFAIAGAEDLALDERAVTRLELTQLGEGVRDREPVGIAGINTGHQGVDRMVEELLAQAADDKIGDALLFAVTARRDEGLAQHGQFGLQAEQRGGEETERRPGHFDRPAVADDETGRGAGVGIDAARTEAGVPDELADLGRGFQNRVGSELGKIAPLAGGLDGAPDAVAGLVHDHRQALALQIKGRGESGDSSADDSNGSHAGSVAETQESLPRKGAKHAKGGG